MSSSSLGLPAPVSQQHVSETLKQIYTWFKTESAAKVAQSLVDGGELEIMSRSR